MILDDFAIYTTGLVMLIPMRTLVRVAPFVFLVFSRDSPLVRYS
jgi:hypothetical protein